LAKADTAFQAHPSVNRLNLGLSEQIGAGLREPDERSTLVHHQPAALDRQVQAGLIFGWRCALPKQKWRLIFSMGIRPSCTATTALAISTILRAAFSGSE
jgi:hypothetical protein